jgi:hypothetical protein
MILHGFLVYQHAAEEHEGENEEPECGDGEVREKHLHAHIVREMRLTLKYIEVTKKVIE